VGWRSGPAPTSEAPRIRQTRTNRIKGRAERRLAAAAARADRRVTRLAVAVVTAPMPITGIAQLPPQPASPTPQRHMFEHQGGKQPAACRSSPGIQKPPQALLADRGPLAWPADSRTDAPTLGSQPRCPITAGCHYAQAINHPRGFPVQPPPAFTPPPPSPRTLRCRHSLNQAALIAQEGRSQKQAGLLTGRSAQAPARRGVVNAYSSSVTGGVVGDPAATIGQRITHKG